MANKWRVSFEGRVMGHYTGKDPEEAVEKAMTAYKKNCSPIFYPYASFTVERAGSRDAEQHLVVIQ